MPVWAAISRRVRPSSWVAVRRWAWSLGGGEEVGLVGAEGAGADGAFQDEDWVVPGLGGLGVGGAGVLPGGVQGLAVGGGWQAEDGAGVAAAQAAGVDVGVVDQVPGDAGAAGAEAADGADEAGEDLGVEVGGVAGEAAGQLAAGFAEGGEQHPGDGDQPCLAGGGVGAADELAHDGVVQGPVLVLGEQPAQLLQGDGALGGAVADAAAVQRQRLGASDEVVEFGFEVVEDRGGVAHRAAPLWSGGSPITPEPANTL